MNRVPTSSQTIGPFFRIGLDRLCSANFADDAVHGERIFVKGAVLDGDGKAVPDALLEIWQADGEGRYGDNAGDKSRFRGFGRVATDEQGRFQFATIKPGRVKVERSMEMAPHLVVSVFMRGLLTRLVTRIYFPNEAKNADDPVLRLVPTGRRDTLIAKASMGRLGTFEWNVVLQGPNETVFFSC
jgi:protocatechuate 3,4-dioxygenase alpha subunit